MVVKIHQGLGCAALLLCVLGCDGAVIDGDINTERSSLVNFGDCSTELCAGGEDEDCDGKIDCDDMECSEDPRCGCSGESFELCGEVGDEDCDGAADCADSDCATDPSCASSCRPSGELELCTNGIDDECDGLVDCADPDCAGNGSCPSVCSPQLENCTNGSDEDCDGQIDCGDADCASDPACTGCVASVDEICGNGTDDDCDGDVDCFDDACGADPGCTIRCEDTEGNNCNGDMGYGDACAPGDNTRGCSDDRFIAWCNRRNPQTEGVWDTYLSNWVDERCDGIIFLEDEQYADYHCQDSSGITYRCRTPLVFVFDGAPVTYLPWSGMPVFDLGGDGRGYAHDWPTSRTPWLALDRDGDGNITSARELFGSAIARNGFEALKILDTNRDGKITAADAGFARLVLWYDDGDRRSTARELVTLASAGIESVDLDYAVSPRCDARGNCERERAGFTWRDTAGATHSGSVVDVHLREQRPLLACFSPR